MTLDLLDLYIGSGTISDQQDVFNHRFSLFPEYNFIYLKDEIDDYDLFHLIQEEKDSNINHNKDYLRFVLPPQSADHYELFATLNYSIESMDIMMLNKPLTALHNDTYKVSLIEEHDFEEWLAFNFSFEDDLDAAFEKQLKDLLHLHFKQKAHTIYLVKHNDKIIASLSTHKVKDYTHVDEPLVHPSFEDENLEALLISSVDADKAVTLIAQDTPVYDVFVALGYKTQQSLYSCTHYF